MKRKVILLVTGILLAAAVWLLIENRPSPDGPVYQGKTVRQWLAEVFTANQTAALAAFREMGTNAFPAIIQELKKNDSPWDKTRRWIYPRLPASLKARWHWPAEQQNIWSAATLVLINNRQVLELVPELVQILENKHYYSRSYLYSTVIALAGPQNRKCVPELTASLHDNDLDTRTAAAVLLWKIDGQTNVAVAALKEAFNAKGPSYMKDWAPYYLSEIHPLDNSLIPAFIANLQGTNLGVQLNSFRILERYGLAATSAVPALTNLVNSPNFTLHDQALHALKKIDPETAAKYEKNAIGHP